MNIIAYQKNLDEVVSKYGLLDSAEFLKQEHGVVKISEIERNLKNFEKKQKELKIGVIGRVKAGKSSLLNALFFDGKEVLPKAATPMTASLVILKYGKEKSVEVEFFTKDDIKDIEKKHNEYEKRLKELAEEEFQRLKEKKLAKNNHINRLKEKFINENELREKALKSAKSKLKDNEKLIACYDQYERIKKSPINLDELQKTKIIKANSLDELKEYVGANGRYMPYTKSVTLSLPDESLKELQIVDTPGINDPVSSREERTRELLKECDVIFIVSPAGQFLSNEDINLLDRVRNKEGIIEIRIIASQIDHQLFGSEKEKAQGILQKTIENVTTSLTNYLRNVFSKEEYLKDNKDLKSLSKSNVLYSSAICYAIAKKINDKKELDENEKHVFNRLKKDYPDYFSEDIALDNLNLLANIEEIKKTIEEIKIKKEKIIKDRSVKYLEAKINGVENFKKSLIKEIEEKIIELKNTDLAQIQDKKENLQSIINTSFAINERYEELIEDLNIEIEEKIIGELNKIFKEARGEISNAEGTETEAYEVSVSKWWNFWGHTETRYRTYTTVRAGYIRNAIEDMTDEVESLIDTKARELLNEWKKSMRKDIVSTLRENVGDENLKTQTLDKIIKRVISSIEYPNIEFDNSLPSELRKSGTLTGYSAEQFIENARDYLTNLKGKIKKQIKKYKEKLYFKLKDIDIAKKIFEKYEREIEELENNIKNKELAIEKFERAIKELKQVNDTYTKSSIVESIKIDGSKDLKQKDNDKSSTIDKSDEPKNLEQENNDKSPTIDELKKYEKDFNEDSFWEKVTKYAKDIGKETIYKALVLFYAFKDGECSVNDKLIIIGALGYLILPFDLIPDFTPIIGFSDDIGAIAMVYNKIIGCATKEIEQKAEEKLKEWFEE